MRESREETGMYNHMNNECSGEQTVMIRMYNHMNNECSGEQTVMIRTHTENEREVFVNSKITNFCTALYVLYQ